MSRLRIPVYEGDWMQGPQNAPVTLVEYGDYECPYCGQAYSIIKQIQKRFEGRLLFVFRNFPLTQAHPHAEIAATAAEAAGLQGAFWEMHDALYENQDRLDYAGISEIAETLNLNLEKLELDMKSDRVLKKIRSDFQGGVRSGVSGTPGFFINGVRYLASWDFDSLVVAIEEALRSSEAA